MRSFGFCFALLAALALGGCSTPDNTELLPLGSRCTQASDCGTRPYDCLTTDPGGYCTKTCMTSADCPTDGICVGGRCLRKCSATDDPANGCRASEGYACRQESAGGTGVLVCEPAP